MNPPQNEMLLIIARHLVEVTTELFAAYGMEVIQIQSDAGDRLGPPDRESIVATIGYVGEKFRGALVLAARRTAVESWLAAMGENPETTDVSDTLGEFSNMLLGGMKSRLAAQGLPILLSTPTTASGHGLSLAVPSSPSLWIAFQGPSWRVDVCVAAMFEPGFRLQEAPVAREAAMDAGELLLF
ncbi:MAG TPA: chemotaxis protein CheX [Polyangiaceae bacterium]